MYEGEIVEVVASVSLAELAKAAISPELMSQVQEMMEAGISMATAVSVLNDNGYGIVLIPMEDEDSVEEDAGPEQPSPGLFDRFRSLFGSMTAQPVTEAQMGYRVRPADKAYPVAKDYALEGLTIRSAMLASSHEEIVATIGPWVPEDAHYIAESPFLDNGVACSNCVAFEEGFCCWVAGPVAEEGVCKLWVIPERVLKAADTHTPPKNVQEEAQRAVEWIKEGHAGDGFTAVGRRRASDLAAGRAVSSDTVRRMANYFTRHEKDSQAEGYSPGEKGYPSPGRVAWAAWGGNPGKSWANSILTDLEKGQPDVGSVHVDAPLGAKKKPKKTEGIASIFAKADERKFTLGPWYVPDSYDAHGEWTGPDELQQALWDYVRTSDRQIRLQHDTSVVAGEWVEALTWPYPVTVPMLDVERDEVVEHEFPAGTVFMGVLWEDWSWDLVKQGKIRGYSIGGQGKRVMVDLPMEESL